MENKMVLGAFSDRNDAEHAINALKSAGYNVDDISIMMKDREEAREVHDNTGANVAGGTATGAVTGGAVGALAGFLVGVGAITIPGVGAFVAAGPIAAALGLTGAAASTVTGATTGALAGGLIGALTSLGVSQTDAETYEATIKSGGVLLAVNATRENSVDVREMMHEYGVDQTSVIDTQAEVTTRDRHTFENARNSKHHPDNDGKRITMEHHHHSA